MTDSSFAYDRMLMQLAKLKAIVPKLRAQHVDDDAFLEAFAAARVEIEDIAKSLDDAHDSIHCWQLVHEAFDEMLESVGLLKKPWFAP